MGRSTIKEITFFKVPFDNSYRNVYTFPSGKQTGSNINQEFVTNFPNTVWNISVTHPVVLKETNGKLSYPLHTMLLILKTTITVQ